ncbi:MAG: phosphoglucosamine mutase [Streptosporangiaceae bacterium]|nr:phosphoglucosamine mutase [Streptosporangiaceae bacterium]MBV9854579.1 phosphoglucosamine mutase [Streptosporangiaceae bacterium]
MGRMFGTDGVRGIAGRDLTAQLAMDLATAAVPVLAGDPGDAADARRHTRPVAVIGRDPRASGDFLEAAVVAGLAGSGVDVLRLGIVPSPGVAYLTGALGADFGVVLSASHNPAPDNGIKFFGRGGVKLPDEVEDRIEDQLRSGAPAHAEPGFGRVTDAQPKQEGYLEHLLATLPGTDGRPPLAGLRVVVDCAHGAAYSIAPRALRQAGAEVIAIGAAPDGLNINSACGSTHLDALSAAVVDHGADAGLAFDGDADRCLAVDADGAPLDGDQILTVLAAELKETGRLAGDAVVVTVMSNLGFRAAMRDAGITVIETPVGDKHVYAAMREGGYVLGGEQSGHIIQLDHATTGDGVLTGLHLLAAVNRRGVPMAAAAKMMTRYPQVLINVRGDKSRAMAAPGLGAAVEAARARLGGAGRVLLRPSGTEPAIRVMVEATDAREAERVANQLADAVHEAMAGSA